MIKETNTFLDYLKKSIGDQSISYKDYIQLCLYHPTHGYYTKQKKRVGRTSDSDFYTAESLGPLFAKLIIAAVRNLLQSSKLSDDLSEYTFIEIGTEPEYALLSSIEVNPFRDHKILRLGDDLNFEDPKVILFANEWLDAFPFHRLIYKDSKWHERGVGFNNTGQLEERLMNSVDLPLNPIINKLPKKPTENYQIDLSIEAPNVLASLLKNQWKGIALFLDYGKMWDDLAYQRPNGTARTYWKHKQGTNLLKHPSEADITCDVCWDLMIEAIDSNPKTQCTLQSQEAFFIQRAGSVIEPIISESAFTFSKNKQTLMELVHPSHMGRRFQVLEIIRN